ncbi:hypothetical protein EMCRGX_G014920 [Ephydatia muelleri]
MIVGYLCEHLDTMGQGNSRIQQTDCQYNDQFLIIGNPTEKVEFDTTQSHLVSFAIDYQSHEKCKPLGSSVMNDAKLVSNTFVQIGVVTEDNTTIHVASQNPMDCTFEGMKRCFIHAAESVEADGMFVFHFCGHGMQFGDNEWGLVPSDFDYSCSTLITAGILNDWLKKASCQAKHVLFALDCCHAGGIGDALTIIQPLHRSLFVVSACTANESSYIVGTLGHSMFSYFLADAARKQTSDPQKLPLYNIMRECRTCCMALSSLLVKYEAPGRVSSCQIDPKITFTEVAQADNDDETDGVPESGRFEYVTKHFDYEAPKLTLHAETKRWLKSIVESIAILRDRDLLKDKVLNTAVCSIMMSIASYELAFQRDKVSHPNIFIVAFLHTASLFDFPDVDVTINHFKHGWGYYDYVLQQNTAIVDDVSYKALLNTILKVNNDRS